MIRRYYDLLACFVLMITGLGCTTVTPIGPGYIYEPNAKEERLWESSREISASFRASGELYDDEQLQGYIQSILERVVGNNLSAYVPLDLRVFILDSPIVNAFVLPNGHVFIHTGFLGRIRNEAQLAMVLGHEITHATHRHTDQCNDDTTARTNILAYISVLTVVGGANIHNAVTGVSSLLTTAAISGYSRDKEEEADQVGLTLISQAGYSPSEGAKMFQQMVDASEEGDRRWNALYATHPKMSKRVKSCARLLKRIHPELVTKAQDIGQDRYVQHASGLIYKEVETHIAQGKYDLALETLMFMQKAQPTKSLPQRLLGDLYRARNIEGDSKLTESAYRTALSLDGQCAEAHRGLGFLFMKNGNNARARNHLRNYLMLKPAAEDCEIVQQYVDQLKRGG